MTLRINLEDLIFSANHARGQCEELASGHVLSGNQIENARSGWVDSSASAISARLDAWQENSNVLLARLGEHVQGLQAAAVTAVATEDARAQALGRLAEAWRC